MLTPCENVLLLLPHEDDEVFCAGTLSWLLRRKAHLTVQVVTRRAGEDVRIQADGTYKTYDSNTRHGEFERSMIHLQMTGNVTVLDSLFSNNEQHRLDVVPRADLVRKLESTVHTVRPDLIILPAPSYDQDHVALFLATLPLMRPHYFSGSVWTYPVFREPAFSPRLFIKLDEEDMKQRLDIARCYRTQQSSDLHLISPETQQNTMEYFGRMVFTKWAEAFEVQRMTL